MRKLGTATPFGCNDNIDVIGILSFPTCRSVNVMDIFNFTAIVLDISGHSLVKPVGIKKDEIDKRSFLKLSFANKDLDGINLGNILHHSIQHYVIKCISDLRQIGGFLRVLRFPPPIKLIAMI